MNGGLRDHCLMATSERQVCGCCYFGIARFVHRFQEAPGVSTRAHDDLCGCSCFCVVVDHRIPCCDSRWRQCHFRGHNRLWPMRGLEHSGCCCCCCCCCRSESMSCSAGSPLNLASSFVSPSRFCRMSTRDRHKRLYCTANNNVLYTNAARTGATKMSDAMKQDTSWIAVPSSGSTVETCEQQPTHGNNFKMYSIGNANAAYRCRIGTTIQPRLTSTV